MVKEWKEVGVLSNDCVESNQEAIGLMWDCSDAILMKSQDNFMTTSETRVLGFGGILAQNMTNRSVGRF